MTEMIVITNDTFNRTKNDLMEDTKLTTMFVFDNEERATAKLLDLVADYVKDDRYFETTQNDVFQLAKAVGVEDHLDAESMYEAVVGVKIDNEELLVGFKFEYLYNPDDNETTDDLDDGKESNNQEGPKAGTPSPANPPYIMDGRYGTHDSDDPNVEYGPNGEILYHAAPPVGSTEEPHPDNVDDYAKAHAGETNPNREETPDGGIIYHAAPPIGSTEEPHLSVDEYAEAHRNDPPNPNREETPDGGVIYHAAPPIGSTEEPNPLDGATVPANPPTNEPHTIAPEDKL